MKKTAGRRSFYAFFCLRAGGWVLRRPGGEQVLRLRARDGAFRAPARVTYFFWKKKVTKENHLDLRSMDPWRGEGKRKFGGADLAELVRRGTLSVRGIACTACAAAADNSEGRGWYAGRFWRLSNRAFGALRRQRRDLIIATRPAHQPLSSHCISGSGASGTSDPPNRQRPPPRQFREISTAKFALARPAPRDP